MGAGSCQQQVTYSNKVEDPLRGPKWEDLLSEGYSSQDAVRLVRHEGLSFPGVLTDKLDNKG